MSKTQAKELAIFFPEATEVTLWEGSPTFELKPMTFRESQMIAKEVGNVLHIFTGDFSPAMLAVAYDHNFDGIVRVLAHFYGLTPEQIEGFSLDIAMKAITEIIKVNKSFFDARMATTMDELSESLGVMEGK